MSHSSQDPKNPQLPNKVIDLLVSDIFSKNNININEAKKNISDEQKKMLRELVLDLSKQVDQFVNDNEDASNVTTEKQKKIRFKK
ncbi:spore coat protein [Niallia sp. XMNu-256]|uniref:spore coat protein n=1 Tax=Niallia sp. XMNu-256 TaxID=3082444 RepID=UPI0030D2640C